MIKIFQFQLLVFLILFTCYAQENSSRSIIPKALDTLCLRFHELTYIDFDVSQKSGCEFLITQLLNKTTCFLEDTLTCMWSVFNDDYSIHFVFSEESPDIFLYEPGNYHVALIITNTYGCRDSLTKYNIISLDKMPQIDFTFTPENALFAEYFGEVEFTNLTDPELLSDTTVVWLWDFGDHVMNKRNPSPVHLFSMWGDYHTTFHLKTKNGCKVSITKTVTIEDELFFPDTLIINSKTAPIFFAVTNLNTHIPNDAFDEFRTNYLFIYDETGEKVYEQKNYDSYIKNGIIIEGIHSVGIKDLQKGDYYYSFYYKGKSKMVHYNGVFRNEK